MAFLTKKTVIITPSTSRFHKTGHKRRLNAQKDALCNKHLPCMDCGGRYPSECMEFDHRDPSRKKFNISLHSGYSVKQFATEIAKCDLVCANCHRVRTRSRHKGFDTFAPISPFVVR